MRSRFICAIVLSAGLVGVTQRRAIDDFLLDICSANTGTLSHPVTLVAQRRALPSFTKSAIAAEPSPCQSPTTYQKLPEIEAPGDLSVPMTVEAGSAAGGSVITHPRPGV
jgi:hypothetical protein